MSKTIDVEKGDTWTICESNGLSVVYQYRNERTIWMFEKASARKPGLTCRTSSEKDVPQAAALMILEAWGYATPAAKDEAPAKTEPVICSACRTFGCDDHVPDAKPEPTPGVFHLKCPQCCFVCQPDGDWVRRMCGCKHKDALVRVDGPLPERKPTPDVPVVDAVWVEVTLGKDRRALYACSDEASAFRCNGTEITNGTARIVRLAPDAALAALKAEGEGKNG